MKTETFGPNLYLYSNSSQKAHTLLWIEPAILLVVLLCAYLLRVIYPDLYITGFDMAGHVMASMRLHLTSPFENVNWLNNSFVQVLFFDHGYTTILLPWSLYELVFHFIGLRITEARWSIFIASSASSVC